LKEVIYAADSRASLGPIRSLVLLFKNMSRARDFIWQIFLRDLLSSYKKSMIGYSWMIIAPIAGILSWVVMNRAGILNPGNVGVPYPAYILSGMLMWGFFMSCFNAASGTLTAGSGLIQQVNYPHEVMLIKQIAQQLVGFAINLAVNLIVLMFFHVIPGWQIIFLPLVLIPLILFASAMGLWISMLSVITSDVTTILNMGLGFLIYLMPIIYGKQVQNKYLALVMHWNPLTYLVCSARDIILYGRLYGNEGFAIASVMSVFAFIFSLNSFYRLEQKLVERIS
jgi:lipopolysaccharide transport system permease protein